MATKYLSSNLSAGAFNITQPLIRYSNKPLETTGFYANSNDALTYAGTEPAYIGQELTVFDTTTTTKAYKYFISNTNEITRLLDERSIYVKGNANFDDKVRISDGEIKTTDNDLIISTESSYSIIIKNINASDDVALLTVGSDHITQELKDTSNNSLNSMSLRADCLSINKGLKINNTERISSAGAGTFTSVNVGSGNIITSGVITGGSFKTGTIERISSAGAGTFTSVNAGSGNITTTGNISGGKLLIDSNATTIDGGNITTTGSVKSSKEFTLEKANTDLYLNFNHSASKCRWKTGVEGTGDGNENYFVIESDKNTEGSNFYKTLQIGLTDLDWTITSKNFKITDEGKTTIESTNGVDIEGVNIKDKNISLTKDNDLETTITAEAIETPEVNTSSLTLGNIKIEYDSELQALKFVM